ncbi:NifU family protein [Streptomyces meridianus]|uniref:NifU family protein n=1 Tax=Streptomyces meridianus TaxID=2938945 RepID=A0ABT0X555_9ACTN|nr:NifU family protein [Streptomyces meridianus]MCM2577672.1 NifU family protein [Streptomyces meridianus]
MSAETTARQVEEVLDRLTSHADPAVPAAAEELVRVLMDFYGTGLARITALLSERGGGAAGSLAPLLADETVSALLALHDLHPEDVRTRIGRALDAAGGDGFTVRELDEETGALRLASSGGGGCPSTADAARQRIEAALSCFAPEVTAVEFEQPGSAAREPALLQIGRRPPGLQPAGAGPASPTGAS